jgi:hypothetical protein
VVDFTTYSQLASIEASTLLAPDGQHDDEADAFCLAQIAVLQGAAETTASSFRLR